MSDWPAPRGTARSPPPCPCRWRSAAQRGAVERVCDGRRSGLRGSARQARDDREPTSRGRARAQQASRPALGPSGGWGMTLDRPPSHLSVARPRVCAAGFSGFSWDGAGGCLPDAERVADSPAGVNGWLPSGWPVGWSPGGADITPMPAVRAVTPGRACQGLLARRHDRERAPGRGAGLAVLAGPRIGSVPESCRAVARERKGWAHAGAAAPGGGLITELRLAEAVSGYAAGQVANGIGPGGGAAVVWEAAAELDRSAVALRRLARLGRRSAGPGAGAGQPGPDRGRRRLRGLRVSVGRCAGTWRPGLPGS